jgi:hypothetical protein
VSGISVEGGKTANTLIASGCYNQSAGRAKACFKPSRTNIPSASRLLYGASSNKKRHHGGQELHAGPKWPERLHDHEKGCLMMTAKARSGVARARNVHANTSTMCVEMNDSDIVAGPACAEVRAGQDPVEIERYV